MTPVSTALVAISPASVSLRVGESQQVTASARDISGVSLPGRTIAWSSQNASVATVNAGLVIGMSPGVTNVVASADGVQATVPVTVSTDIQSITVEPLTPSVMIGTTVQLTATLRNSAGSILSGRSVVWSSSNQASATVPSSGLVQAIGQGAATITATSEGMSGSTIVTITVPVAPVSTVTISPNVSAVTVGGTQQLSATLRDAGGLALTGRAVNWTSSSPGVAQVSSSGLVLAVTPGSATISATSEGRSGAATVTVSAINSISIQNYLIASIEIYTSAGTLGTLGPQQSGSFHHGAATTVNYRLIPAQYSTGANIPNQYFAGSWLNVQQADSRITSNALTGGPTYFSPLITNSTSTAITIELANALGTQCLIVVSANSSSSFAGYYQLDSQTQLRAYVGNSCAGSFRFWSSAQITGLVQQNSGAVSLTYP